MAHEHYCHMPFQIVSLSVYPNSRGPRDARPVTRGPYCICTLAQQYVPCGMRHSSRIFLHFHHFTWACRFVRPSRSFEGPPVGGMSGWPTRKPSLPMYHGGFRSVLSPMSAYPWYSCLLFGIGFRLDPCSLYWAVVRFWPLCRASRVLTTSRLLSMYGWIFEILPLLLVWWVHNDRKCVYKANKINILYISHFDFYYLKNL